MLGFSQTLREECTLEERLRSISRKPTWRACCQGHGIHQSVCDCGVYCRAAVLRPADQQVLPIPLCLCQVQTRGGTAPGSFSRQENPTKRVLGMSALLAFMPHKCPYLTGV